MMVAGRRCAAQRIGQLTADNHRLAIVHGRVYVLVGIQLPFGMILLESLVAHEAVDELSTDRQCGLRPLS